MSLLIIVLCVLCCNFVRSDTYKAAVVDVTKIDIRSSKYELFIAEAARNNVDLLVIPTAETVSENSYDSCCSMENYDEIVKSVSSAARKAHIYVVTNLYEKSRCQNREELIKSNLVFNRDGAVISVFRKPVNSQSKCNMTISKISHFTTDFGVLFGVINEVDILISQQFDGIKNFIVTSNLETSFLFAKQFSTSWAFVNNLNVINENGKLSGPVNLQKASDFIIAEFEKHGANENQKIFTTSPPSTYTANDISQYIIKPLELESSTKGYEDTLCHHDMCCQFYVKTSYESKPQVTYGLVAYNGVHNVGNNNIGVQTCSVVACAGMYKRSCFVGSENNNTNINFETIIINMNKTNKIIYYPTILTTNAKTFNSENFRFTAKNTIKSELHDTDNVLIFGIFARDNSIDYIIDKNNTDIFIDFSKYISYGNFQEYFDYLWIRLRVLIFVVSIYVLEMM